MARGRLTFTVRPGPEWRRVRAQLGVEQDIMPPRLHRTLRENAEQMAARAQARVRRLPIRGTSGRHTGMRQRVAAGVKVVNAPGGAVRITTSMPERDEAVIPRGLDSPKGWRHPVFGNKAVWVRQRPVRSGWFMDSMGEQRDDIEDDLHDQLEASAERIASRGNNRGVPG